jgi:hypothetical protein
MVVSLYWLVLPLVKGKPIKSKGSFQQQQQNKKQIEHTKTKFYKSFCAPPTAEKKKKTKKRKKPLGVYCCLSRRVEWLYNNFIPQSATW